MKKEKRKKSKPAWFGRVHKSVRQTDRQSKQTT